MITYPRNTEALYHLYRLSTETIEQESVAYPEPDGNPIEGLDEDLVYLEIKSFPVAPPASPYLTVESETAIDVSSGTHTTREWYVNSMTFTYPRQTKDENGNPVWYTQYDLQAGTVVKDRVRYPRTDGMPVNGQPGNLVHLASIHANLIPNPLTQRIGEWLPPVIDLQAGTATYARSIIDLTLEEVKERKGQTLKDRREEMLAGGFTFGGKHYQTRNDADRINIMGVGTAAQAALAAGVPFSVNFRATDNTAVAMDAATGSAFYQTMIGAAQQIWDAYNAADAALQEAATVTEAEGVVL